MRILSWFRARVLTGWNFRRVLFLATGIWLLTDAFRATDLMLGVMGSYFALSGLLALGCAGGNCAYVPPSSAGSSSREIEYGEIGKS